MASRYGIHIRAIVFCCIVILCLYIGPKQNIHHISRRQISTSFNVVQPSDKRTTGTTISSAVQPSSTTVRHVEPPSTVKSAHGDDEVLFSGNESVGTLKHNVRHIFGNLLLPESLKSNASSALNDLPLQIKGSIIASNPFKFIQRKLMSSNDLKSDIESLEQFSSVPPHSGTKLEVSISSSPHYQAQPQRRSVDQLKHQNIESLLVKLNVATILRKNIIAGFGFALYNPEQTLPEELYVSLLNIYNAIRLTQIQTLDVIHVLGHMLHKPLNIQLMILLKEIEKIVPKYLQHCVVLWRSAIFTRSVDVNIVFNRRNQKTKIDFLRNIKKETFSEIQKRIIFDQVIADSSFDWVIKLTGKFYANIVGVLTRRHLNMTREYFAYIMLQLPVEKFLPEVEESRQYIADILLNKSNSMFPLNFSSLTFDTKPDPYKLVRSILSQLSDKQTPLEIIECIDFLSLYMYPPNITRVYEKYHVLNYPSHKVNINFTQLFQIVTPAEFPDDIIKSTNDIVQYIHNNPSDISIILEYFNFYYYQTPWELLISFLSKMRRLALQSELIGSIKALRSHIVLKFYIWRSYSHVKTNLNTITALSESYHSPHLPRDVRRTINNLTTTLNNEYVHWKNEFHDFMLQGGCRYSFLTFVQELGRKLNFTKEQFITDLVRNFIKQVNKSGDITASCYHSCNNISKMTHNAFQYVFTFPGTETQTLNFTQTPLLLAISTKTDLPKYTTLNVQVDRTSNLPSISIGQLDEVVYITSTFYKVFSTLVTESQVPETIHNVHEDMFTLSSEDSVTISGTESEATVALTPINVEESENIKYVNSISNRYLAIPKLNNPRFNIETLVAEIPSDNHAQNYILLKEFLNEHSIISSVGPNCNTSRQQMPKSILLCVIKHGLTMNNIRINTTLFNILNYYDNLLTNDPSTLPKFNINALISELPYYPDGKWYGVLVRFLSEPKLPEIIGPSFNAASFPTTKSLLQAIIRHSMVVDSLQRDIELIEALDFYDDVLSVNVKITTHKSIIMSGISSLLDEVPVIADRRKTEILISYLTQPDLYGQLGTQFNRSAFTTPKSLLKEILKQSLKLERVILDSKLYDVINYYDKVLDGKLVPSALISQVRGMMDEIHNISGSHDSATLPTTDFKTKLIMNLSQVPKHPTINTHSTTPSNDFINYNYTHKTEEMPFKHQSDIEDEEVLNALIPYIDLSEEDEIGDYNTQTVINHNVISFDPRTLPLPSQDVYITEYNSNIFKEDEKGKDSSISIFNKSTDKLSTTILPSISTANYVKNSMEQTFKTVLPKEDETNKNILEKNVINTTHRPLVILTNITENLIDQNFNILPVEDENSNINIEDKFTGTIKFKLPMTSLPTVKSPENIIYNNLKNTVLSFVDPDIEVIEPIIVTKDDKERSTLFPHYDILEDNHNRLYHNIDNALDDEPYIKSTSSDSNLKNTTSRIMSITTLSSDTINKKTTNIVDSTESQENEGNNPQILININPYQNQTYESNYTDMSSIDINDDVLNKVINSESFVSSEDDIAARFGIKDVNYYTSTDISQTMEKKVEPLIDGSSHILLPENIIISTKYSETTTAATSALEVDQSSLVNEVGLLNEATNINNLHTNYGKSITISNIQPFQPYGNENYQHYTNQSSVTTMTGKQEVNSLNESGMHNAELTSISQEILNLLPQEMQNISINTGGYVTHHNTSYSTTVYPLVSETIFNEGKSSTASDNMSSNATIAIRVSWIREYRSLIKPPNLHNENITSLSHTKKQLTETLDYTSNATPVTSSIDNHATMNDIFVPSNFNIGFNVPHKSQSLGTNYQKRKHIFVSELDTPGKSISTTTKDNFSDYNLRLANINNNSYNSYPSSLTQTSVMTQNSLNTTSTISVSDTIKDKEHITENYLLTLNEENNNNIPSHADSNNLINNIKGIHYNYSSVHDITITKVYATDDQVPKGKKNEINSRNHFDNIYDIYNVNVATSSLPTIVTLNTLNEDGFEINDNDLNTIHENDSTEQVLTSKDDKRISENQPFLKSLMYTTISIDSENIKKKSIVQSDLNIENYYTTRIEYNSSNVANDIANTSNTAYDTSDINGLGHYNIDSTSQQIQQYVLSTYNYYTNFLAHYSNNTDNTSNNDTIVHNITTNMNELYHSNTDSTVQLIEQPVPHIENYYTTKLYYKSNNVTYDIDNTDNNHTTIHDTTTDINKLNHHNIDSTVQEIEQPVLHIDNYYTTTLNHKSNNVIHDIDNTGKNYTRITTDMNDLNHPNTDSTAKYIEQSVPHIENYYTNTLDHSSNNIVNTNNRTHNTDNTNNSDTIAFHSTTNMNSHSDSTVKQIKVNNNYYDESSTMDTYHESFITFTTFINNATNENIFEISANSYQKIHETTATEPKPIIHMDTNYMEMETQTPIHNLSINAIVNFNENEKNNDILSSGGYGSISDHHKNSDSLVQGNGLIYGSFDDDSDNPMSNKIESSYINYIFEGDLESTTYFSEDGKSQTAEGNNDNRKNTNLTMSNVQNLSSPNYSLRNISIPQFSNIHQNNDNTKYYKYLHYGSFDTNTNKNYAISEDRQLSSSTTMITNTLNQSYHENTSSEAQNDIINTKSNDWNPIDITTETSGILPVNHNISIPTLGENSEDIRGSATMATTMATNKAHLIEQRVMIAEGSSKQTTSFIEQLSESTITPPNILSSTLPNLTSVLKELEPLTQKVYKKLITKFLKQSNLTELLGKNWTKSDVSTPKLMLQKIIGNALNLNHIHSNPKLYEALRISSKILDKPNSSELKPSNIRNILTGISTKTNLILLNKIIKYLSDSRMQKMLRISSNISSSLKPKEMVQALIKQALKSGNTKIESGLFDALVHFDTLLTNYDITQHLQNTSLVLREVLRTSSGHHLKTLLTFLRNPTLLEYLGPTFKANNFKTFSQLIAGIMAHAIQLKETQLDLELMKTLQYYQEQFMHILKK